MSSESDMAKLKTLFEAHEAAKATFEQTLRETFAEARCACQPCKEKMRAALKAYQKQLLNMMGVE